MKSIPHGKNISGVRVTNINKHGIWLLTRDHELFISFKEFPWFQDTTVRKLMNVEQLTPTCLHWPDSGIDLAVESVRCFPLVSPTPRSAARSSQQAKPGSKHFTNTIGHAKSTEGDTAQNSNEQTSKLPYSATFVRPPST